MQAGKIRACKNALIARRDGATAHGTFGSSLTAYFIADRQLTPKIRTLVDFLVERFGKSPAWDRGIHVGGTAKAR